MHAHSCDEASGQLSTVISTSNTSNLTIAWPLRLHHEVVINSLVLGTLIFLALVGNTAVIYAIFKTPKLRKNNANIFILNLSITDMSSAFLVMSTSLVMVGGDFRKIDRFWCGVSCAANYMLITTSMLILAFVSVDRYFAVVHPLTYNLHMTKKRILYMVSWAWIQGCVFGGVPVVRRWDHYDYWEVTCAIAWHQEKPASIFYVVFAFLLCFAAPGIIMLFSYTSIIIEANNWKKDPVKAAVPRTHRSSKKIIRSLLMVVACYFLFMTPFCVTKLLKVIYVDPNFVPPYANLVASYMAYASSVINPFIYGMFRADFRLAYTDLIRRLSCGRVAPMTPVPAKRVYTSSVRTRVSIFSLVNKPTSPTGLQLL